jgi:hypothetical protein
MIGLVGLIPRLYGGQSACSLALESRFRADVVPIAEAIQSVRRNHIQKWQQWHTLGILLLRPIIHQSLKGALLRANSSTSFVWVPQVQQTISVELICCSSSTQGLALSLI